MTSEPARAWWQRRLFLAAIIILFALPLALAGFPPLIDLPAHMARYHIGASLADSRDLGRYFSFQWRFLPNLGVDILVIALAPLTGIEPAVRLIVTAIPALAAAGMIGVARVAHGQLPATAFFALPLAFAYPLVFGFVNSALAVALAFIVVAVWLRFERRNHNRAAAILATIAAPILLTAHITGFGVLGVAIFGATIGRAIEQRWPLRRTLTQLLLSCLPVIWPFIILLFWSTGTAPPVSGWLDWHSRIAWLAGILRDNWAPLDIASAALVYAVMLLPLLRPRHFTYTPVLAMPGLILWILALGLPTTLITQFASVRLIYVACAFTLLAVRPKAPLPSWVAPAGLAFVALRLTSVLLSTIEADGRFEKQLEALDHIARGSRVIAFTAIDCERHWQPDRRAHIASMATVRRDAFVNDQFVTSEGQLLKIAESQPVLKRWTEAIVFKTPCDRWSNRPALSEALTRLPWGNMDYLWLVDAPAASRPIDGRLRPIWQAGNSVLYRIGPRNPPPSGRGGHQTPRRGRS